MFSNTKCKQDRWMCWPPSSLAVYTLHAAISSRSIRPGLSDGFRIFFNGVSRIRIVLRPPHCAWNRLSFVISFPALLPSGDIDVHRLLRIIFSWNLIRKGPRWDLTCNAASESPWLVFPPRLCAIKHWPSLQFQPFSQRNRTPSKRGTSERPRADCSILFRLRHHYTKCCSASSTESHRLWKLHVALGCTRNRTLSAFHKKNNEKESMKVLLTHASTHMLTQHPQHQSTQSHNSAPAMRKQKPRRSKRTALVPQNAKLSATKACPTFIFERIATFKNKRLWKRTKMLHLPRKVSTTESWRSFSSA